MSVVTYHAEAGTVWADCDTDEGRWFGCADDLSDCRALMKEAVELGFLVHDGDLREIWEDGSTVVDLRITQPLPQVVAR